MHETAAQVRLKIRSHGPSGKKTACESPRQAIVFVQQPGHAEVADATGRGGFPIDRLWHYVTVI